MIWTNYTTADNCFARIWIHLMVSKDSFTAWATSSDYWFSHNSHQGRTWELWQHTMKPKKNIQRMWGRWWIWTMIPLNSRHNIRNFKSLLQIHKKCLKILLPAMMHCSVPSRLDWMQQGYWERKDKNEIYVGWCTREMAESFEGKRRIQEAYHPNENWEGERITLPC